MTPWKSVRIDHLLLDERSPEDVQMFEGAGREPVVTHAAGHEDRAGIDELDREPQITLEAFERRVEPLRDIGRERTEVLEPRRRDHPARHLLAHRERERERRRVARHRPGLE
jgi:hypothetical protein